MVSSSAPATAAAAITFGFKNLMETFTVDVHRAENRPLNVPLIAPFTIASSRLEMVENVAVRIELSNGSVGWGEAPILPFVTAEDQKIAMAKASEACAFLRRCPSLTLGSMLEDIVAILPGHEFASVNNSKSSRILKFNRREIRWEVGEHLLPKFCRNLYPSSEPICLVDIKYVLKFQLENVTVAQVKQYCEMESHEEKLHRQMREDKIREANDEMKRKANEIDKNKCASFNQKAIHVKQSHSSPLFEVPTNLKLQHLYHKFGHDQVDLSPTLGKLEIDRRSNHIRERFETDYIIAFMRACRSSFGISSPSLLTSGALCQPDREVK
ncbi:hypothetical protein Ahy_B04g071290 [Arachis hypogaea]|uniref:Mandelate racemase/muconate lactonizing enzyme N-terminal domain-containing protein n=1 Tax=Arachis hypogaea TaxID=3818 RepID=A0A444ZKE6_ARAHY|nr:hypothetical protein Ahy_B04g071290 [Arachis hypogaea]